MMEKLSYNTFNRCFSAKLIIIALLLCCSYTLRAQEKPPRPVQITVSPSQGLYFGAFSQGGSGGTVILSPTGVRSSTGSIILLNLGFTFAAAIFQVDAEPGTIVTIVNGTDVTLTGSGGGSMMLHIGTASPTSPFIATAISPSRTQIRIGGTLTVGNSLSSPPGSYSGTFSVTFVQQ